ncbi:hypothetical protein BLNAU_14373 [Blattamonas nauphoetae]|uniref:G8 domain-containing protein n=1 Tax=Blattamonas nauphoetae TaxID=2049346 RepID=A0ABQ9XH95_9EUKA|nr:hypothetical protein BLNAU_14373 [Blattamonas nauphoetae]
MFSLFTVLKLCLIGCYLHIRAQEAFVVINPSHSSSDDSLKCGTAELPCQTIEYAYDQRTEQTDITKWIFKIQGTMICEEFYTCTVTKTVEVRGDSTANGIFGLADDDPMETVFIASGDLHLTLLSLERHGLCSVVHVHSKGAVKVTNCLISSKLQLFEQWKDGWGDMFVVLDGSFSIESCTLKNFVGEQPFCVLNIKGGSASILSLGMEANPTVKTTTQALLLHQGGDFSIRNTAFQGVVRQQGSPAVLESLSSSGTLTLEGTKFIECTGSQTKRVISITRSSNFVAGCVVMKNVQFLGNDAPPADCLHLTGLSIETTVTAATFENTLPSYDAMSRAHIDAFRGSVSPSSTSTFSLMLFLHPYVTGSAYVDSSMDNHEKCGLDKLGCKTLEYAYAKLVGTEAQVILKNDQTLTLPLAARTGTTGISTATNQEHCKLTFSEAAYITIASGSNFHISNLKLDTSAPRKADFVIVKGGTVTFDTVMISVSNIPSSAIVVESGKATLIDLSVPPTPPEQASHFSLLSLLDGEAELASSNFSPEAPLLITQTFIEHKKGALKIADSVFNKIHRQTPAEQCEIQAQILSSSSFSSLTLNNCSFTDIAEVDNGCVVLVRKEEGFSPSSVVMKNCLFSWTPTASTPSLSSPPFVLMSGPSISSTVTPESFSTTIPAIDSLTPSTIFLLRGRETNTADSPELPLALFVHPYLGGSLFLSKSFVDHPNCGREQLPCLTLAFGYSNVKRLDLTQNDAVVVMRDSAALAEPLIAHPFPATITTAPTLQLCSITFDTNVFISSGTDSELTLKTLRFISKYDEREKGFVEVVGGHATLSSLSIFLFSSETSCVLVSSGRVFLSEISITTPVDTIKLAFEFTLLRIMSGEGSISECSFGGDHPLHLWKHALFEHTGGQLRVSDTVLVNVFRDDGEQDDKGSLYRGALIHSDITPSETEHNPIPPSITVERCTVSSFSVKHGITAFFVRNAAGFSDEQVRIVDTQFDWQPTRTDPAPLSSPPSSHTLDTFPPISEPHCPYLVLMGPKFSATAVPSCLQGSYPPLSELRSFQLSLFMGTEELDDSVFHSKARPSLVTLFYSLFSYSSGAIYVDRRALDTASCGLLLLPCSTFLYSFHKVKQPNAQILLNNDDMLAEQYVIDKGDLVITSSDSDRLASLLVGDPTCFIVHTASQLTFTEIRIKPTTEKKSTLFVVSGGKLAFIEARLELFNTPSSCVINVESGEVDMDGIVFYSPSASGGLCVVKQSLGTVRLSYSEIGEPTGKTDTGDLAIWEQTGGHVRIEHCFVQNLKRTIGDGAFLNSELSSGSVYIHNTHFDGIRSTNVHAIFITVLPPSTFTENTVTLSHCIFLSPVPTSSVLLVGKNYGDTVSSGRMAGTFLDYDSLGKDDVFVFLGMDNEEDVLEVPLVYGVYPHLEGPVFVDPDFFDHPNCGRAKIPCATMVYASDKMRATDEYMQIAGLNFLDDRIDVFKQFLSIVSANYTSPLLQIENEGGFTVAGTLVIDSLDIELMDTDGDESVFQLIMGMLSLVNGTVDPIRNQEHILFEIKSGQLWMVSMIFLWQNSNPSPAIVGHENMAHLHLSDIARHLSSPIKIGKTGIN